MSKKKAKIDVKALTFLKDAINARLDDAMARESTPTLLECLLPVYEGTKLVRAAGKLTITPEGAHWKVTLQCPTERIQCVFVTNQLPSIMMIMEEWLRSTGGLWSPMWERNKKLPTVDDAIQ